MISDVMFTVIGTVSAIVSFKEGDLLMCFLWSLVAIYALFNLNEKTLVGSKYDY